MLSNKKRIVRKAVALISPQLRSGSFQTVRGSVTPSGDRRKRYATQTSGRPGKSDRALLMDLLHACNRLLGPVIPGGWEPPYEEGSCLFSAGWPCYCSPRVPV